MRRLQSFEFNRSRYERPTQDWICGHAADGRACVAGPDASGRCCTTAECQPRRDGDRWVCTRPASSGGACDPGPMADGTCACPIPPCVPVRSIRARRRLAVRWAVVASLGFVALVLGSAGLAWLMPGPLTQAHVALENCQSCHASVAAGPFDWVHSAFAAATPERDSGLCLNCHNAGQQPMNAHGVSVASLAETTRSVEARMAATGVRLPKGRQSGILPASFPSQSPLPCATCHIEHRGAHVDLTNVTEATCQTCHVEKFETFSRDHPQFVDYPYERRTRIIFDHASHFTRHFPEAAGKNPDLGQAFAACVDCHQTGFDGKLMATAVFESSCAACHADQIRGRGRAIGPRGVAFLVVPGMDEQTLADSGYKIGHWPRFAEATLTPFMAMMLSSDPETKKALETVSSLDLLDLRDATEEQLAAAYRVAWAVKRLFNELSAGGATTVLEHTAVSKAEGLDDDTLTDLMASLPHDVIVSAIDEWLPDLDRELADYAAGKMRTEPKRKPVPQKASAAAAKGPKDTGDILGAPKDTGDILGTAKKDTGDILAAPKDTGDILGAAKKDTGDIFGAPKNTGDILGTAKKDTGDILAAPKDTGDILGAPKKDTGDILGGKDTGDILAGAPKKVDTAPLAPAPVAAPEKAPFDAEKFMDLGGWYRKNYAILFLPTGHADPFLKAWFDYSVGIANGGEQSEVEGIFRALSKDDAPGQCAKCHSIDADASGRLAINWQPRTVNGVNQGFTYFSHAPHLQVGPERGCLTCHQIDREAAYLKAFEGNDPHAFVSNFKPIARETCVECHTPKIAGENCTQCHDYHVGGVATPVMKTRLQDAVASGTSAR
jgi:hypothetical protein